MLTGVVTWIVLAVVSLAFVVLVLAVRPVLARLPALERAARRLRDRQAEAERLAAAAAGLEQRLAAMREQAEIAQRRVAVIQARRGE